MEGWSGSVSNHLIWHERYEINDDGRVCSRCKAWKTWDYFWRKKDGINGRYSACIECEKLATEAKFARSQSARTVTCANDECAKPILTYPSRPRSFCSQHCYSQAGRGRRNWAEKYNITDEGRTCYHCGVWKTWQNYRKNQTTGVNGRAGVCEECQGPVWLLSRYGITPSEYEHLLEDQAGFCALCSQGEAWKPGRSQDWSRQIRRLSVDHDHACVLHSKQKACKMCIRGLLCSACNSRLLPWVESHPPLRARFQDYLARRPFANLRAHPRA